MIIALALAATISGTASVVDGDTLDVHGTRIRIWGIDAPESAQLCTKASKAWRCGQQAALALSDYIARRPISCEAVDRDRYGRIVARCSVAGADIGRWMVSQGWAVDYVQYSRAFFADEQLEAREARRGVWAGEFEAPWDWRKSHPR